MSETQTPYRAKRGRGRPRKNHGKSKPVDAGALGAIGMAPETKDTLDEFCKQTGLTRREVAELAIAAYIDKQGRRVSKLLETRGDEITRQGRKLALRRYILGVEAEE